MAQRVCSKQRVVRLSALTLAVALLWISGGATLRHADDLSALLIFPNGHSAVRHATPPPAAAVCAACEWEQSAASSPPPAVSLITTRFVHIRYSPAEPTSARCRSLDYISVRGPPATNS